MMPILLFEIVTICLEPPGDKCAALLGASYCLQRSAPCHYFGGLPTSCPPSLRRLAPVICSRAMQDADLSQPTPQFDTAEYANTPGTTRCAVCQQTLAGTSYRINGHPVCASCTDQFRNRAPKD